jgi:hypothetical protein
MELRVFVNQRPFSLPAGVTVRDAVAACEPDLLALCDSGVASVTDGRGIAVSLSAPLGNGAILRVLRTSRQASPPAADDGR